MQIPGYDQQETHLYAHKKLVRFHSELWALTMKAYALPMVTTSGNGEAQQIETLVWLLIDILRRKGIMITENTTEEGNEPCM